VEQTLALDRAELEEKLSQSETFVHQLARYSRDEKGMTVYQPSLDGYSNRLSTVIRDQIVTVLLAGRDTTGATLSWVFYELGRNPRVVSKIRKEVLSHVGSDPKSLPSYTNLKEMKYLNHIINETLRLYPIVPYNMRTSLTATTLPRGGGSDGMSPIGVNKDTAIAFSTLQMQRRRDLYPPISDSFPYDPAQWVPERWETWTPKAWQFIPFSGGPRICIGQQFALLEIGYTICRIFQYFSRMDSKVDVGTEVPDIMHSDLVLTPETDVKVGLYK
jgi:cytochrome P450